MAIEARIVRGSYSEKEKEEEEKGSEEAMDGSADVPVRDASPF